MIVETNIPLHVSEMYRDFYVVGSQHPGHPFMVLARVTRREFVEYIRENTNATPPKRFKRFFYRLSTD